MVLNEGMSNAPATLTTTARGVTRPIGAVKVGDYIWHRGAFRRVTDTDWRVIRMGRHTLHTMEANTVEGAPA